MLDLLKFKEIFFFLIVYQFMILNYLKPNGNKNIGYK